MSVAHLTVDQLSAYIDRELGDREKERLEQHLEGCEECRRQLDSLSRVVGRLQRLERISPPQILEMNVQRRVALTAPRPSLLDSFDLRLGRLPIQPGILVTFALVFAFAAILFTFVEALEDRAPQTIPVVLTPKPVAPSEEDHPGTLAEASVWTRSEGEWKLLNVAAGGDADRKVAVGSEAWLGLVTNYPGLDALQTAVQPGQWIEFPDGSRAEIVAP